MLRNTVTSWVLALARFALPAIALCFVVLVPVLAFGQDAATDDYIIPGWLQAIIALAGAFMTFVLEIARRYFGKLMDLAAEKTKLAFLAQLDEIVMDRVAELWQTEGEALKEAAADGKLTQAEKDGLKQKAVDWAMGWLDPQILIDLFGTPAKAREAIGAKVDKHVVKAKNAGKMAKGLAAAKDPSLP